MCISKQLRRVILTLIVTLIIALLLWEMALYAPFIQLITLNYWADGFISSYRAGHYRMSIFYLKLLWHHPLQGNYLHIPEKIADCEMRMGRYDRAIRGFQEQIKVIQNNKQMELSWQKRYISWLYTRLGFTYLMMEDIKKAIEYERKSRELAPDGVWHKGLKGWIYFQQKKFKESIPLLKEFIAANPYDQPGSSFIMRKDQQKSRYLLGIAYWKCGNIKAARNELAEYICLEPFTPEAKKASLILGWKQDALARAQKRKVSIGYLPVMDSLPLFVALENGYFEKRDLKVQAEKFVDSSSLADLLGTRVVDVGVGCHTEVLLSAAQRERNKFRIVMVCARTLSNCIDYIIAREGSEILSLSDLRGKEVGSCSSYFDYATLKLVDMVLKRVPSLHGETEVVPVKRESALQSLIAGDVDAIFALEPVVSEAVERKVGKILTKGPLEKYLLDPFPLTVCVFSTQFIMKNPEGARKVKEALFEAVEFIRTNPKQANKVLTKYISTSVSDITKIPHSIFWKSDEVDKSITQRLADLLHKEGILTERLDTSEMYY